MNGTTQSAVKTSPPACDNTVPRLGTTERWDVAVFGGGRKFLLLRKATGVQVIARKIY